MCLCASLGTTFDAGKMANVVAQFHFVANGVWRDLRRCAECGQLWSVDVPDKYQAQIAVRVPREELWERFDTEPARKQFLLESRGGPTAAICLWKGCAKMQVRGTVYCVDHLYATGARQ